MKHRRVFAVELKRQIVEELLSGMSTPAQLTRRYEISSGLLYHWKEQYAKGHFNNEPTKKAALEDRVRQLEQLVGKLTLENEFLKKAVQRGLLTLPKKSDNSLLNTVTSSKVITQISHLGKKERSKEKIPGQASGSKHKRRRIEAGIGLSFSRSSPYTHLTKFYYVCHHSVTF